MEALWNQYHNAKAGEALKDDAGFWAKQEKPEASRAISGRLINYIKDVLPNLFGGSADLAPSNKTNMKDAGDFSKEDRAGRNLHFGVRELAMAAIGNGIMLHGGLRAYVSTFFVFSDYMKNAVRLSAMMHLRVIYIFTHDSIGVGEDGPTHQPIEQFAALRSIPNLQVIRPADGTETVYAYRSAVEYNGPTAIILSRQNLPQQSGSDEKALKGAYVSSGCASTADCLLIACGSELDLCIKAQTLLEEEHSINAAVISMPSMEIFERQTEEYKQTVIPDSIKARVCVEAGSSMPWYKYAGDNGQIIAIDRFGESGKAEQLFVNFGFSPENVCEKALLSIKKAK